MGRTITAAQSATLARIDAACRMSGDESSNGWVQKSASGTEEYFWEEDVLSPKPDGALVGKAYRVVHDSSIFEGSVRIETDGTVTRGPQFLQRLGAAPEPGKLRAARLT